MSTHLDRLARRLMRDAFFLAAPLARFAESQQLDDDGVAEHLGCDLATLTHLRLCRNPDPDPPHFWRDVERIAGRFGLDPDTFAGVVKLGQALLRTQHPAHEGVGESAGYLLAARDVEPVCESEPNRGDEP
jgi:hypothetical protein